MIDLVEQARKSKGRYERLADRVTAWFLPTVILVAIGALTWHGVYHGIEQGILAGLAVLLIACPCALGLATPLAVWSALGRAARAQIVFRNGAALEHLALVKAIRFDKTGTLTTGNPAVSRLVASCGDEPAREMAAALAVASSHSYAAAIRDFVRPRQEVRTVQSARTLPGLGVVGEVDGHRCYLGSQRLMAMHGLAFDETMSRAVADADDAGQSLTCVGWDGMVRGIFVFREELRPEVSATIAELRAYGLDVAVLTGDSVARGAALARELALPVRAALLPEDKVAALAEARRSFGPVAMVGDGINDAPALAASDVGIALGCGTDVSRDSAAVCLLGNDLLHVPCALALARRTVRVIRQNLFWAFAYNVLGIGLACTGRLNPVLAALAMVLSSFLVVTNSLRLGADERGTRHAGRGMKESGDAPDTLARVSSQHEETVP
jgi:heavy metal translocating P-type ATPase